MMLTWEKRGEYIKIVNNNSKFKQFVYNIAAIVSS